MRSETRSILFTKSHVSAYLAGARAREQGKDRKSPYSSPHPSSRKFDLAWLVGYEKGRAPKCEQETSKRISLINSEPKHHAVLVYDTATNRWKTGVAVLITASEEVYIRGLAKGLTAKQIARQLRVDYRSVESMSRRIRPKFGAADINEMREISRQIMGDLSI